MRMAKRLSELRAFAAVCDGDSGEAMRMHSDLERLREAWPAQVRLAAPPPSSTHALRELADFRPDLALVSAHGGFGYLPDDEPTRRWSLSAGTHADDDAVRVRNLAPAGGFDGVLVLMACGVRRIDERDAWPAEEARHILSPSGSAYVVTDGGDMTHRYAEVFTANLVGALLNHEGKFELEDGVDEAIAKMPRFRPRLQKIQA